MTRERRLTKLELTPASASDKPGWVEARWKRSDDSKGSVFARFSMKSEDSWYIAELLMHLPTGAKLRDVPLAKIEAAANASPEIREWIGESRPDAAEARRRWSQRRRLQAPKTRRLDDAFYQRVADAYRDAVIFGQPPAKTLAADSAVPQGTVNRWIAAARDRGYLAPATQGKVTV
jgi:hypothetical protein